MPANYQIERLRIEQQDQQFTWLWTVRKDGSGANAAIDVVVFFRRSFDPTEERLYSAHWRNLEVAGSGSTAGPQVTVTWGSAPKPFYKKGGFIFDARLAEWYRIQDVLDSDAFRES